VATRYAATGLVSVGLLLLAAMLIAFQAGAHSFDMATTPVSLPGDGEAVAFWLITAASLLAMAVVPLHGALLDLEEDSSGVLSAIFAAVLPSLGRTPSSTSPSGSSPRRRAASRSSSPSWRW